MKSRVVRLTHGSQFLRSNGGKSLISKLIKFPSGVDFVSIYAKAKTGIRR